MHQSLILLLAIFAVIAASLTACQQGSRQDEQIIVVEDIPVKQDNDIEQGAAQAGDFDPEQPVGLPEEEAREYQRGEFLTVIPPDVTAWPNGEPFPPEFLEILEKIDSGAELTEDDRITYTAFDTKWRNWEEIEAIGKSQQDS